MKNRHKIRHQAHIMRTDQIKSRLESLLGESTKRWSKSFGRSLRNLFEQLAWRTSPAAMRSVSSCEKKSLRFCSALQKSRQNVGFWCELRSEMLKSLLSSHLISQCACTESCVYACKTVKSVKCISLSIKHLQDMRAIKRGHAYLVYT